MATFRKITASFIGVGNIPMSRQPVKVQHLSGNNANGVEFPKDGDTYYTNSSGYVDFELWCNEEGERPSLYRITLPDGDYFDTVVPVGTSDLELSVLRDGGVNSGDNQYQTLISYILSQAGSGGGGSIPIASSTVAGKVKVNTTVGDPVVYLKSEVDTALTNKANTSSLTSHTSNTSNPHSVTATQVGKDTAQWNADKIKGVTVDDTSKANGKVLKFNSSTNTLQYADDSTGAGGSTNLDGLTDVTISSPINNQALIYNSTTSQWTNQTLSTGSGEVNTASNVGTAGVGVFKQKNGVNLEFRNINAGSTKVSITNDNANNEIDVDVNEANLSLTNLGGTLSIAKGGTGSTTASAALTALGAASSTDLATHTSATNNPHNTTAAHVGNTTAQWNANKIQGVDVVSTAPTNGQVLTFSSTNSRYEPTTPSSGSSASIFPGHKPGRYYIASSRIATGTASTTLITNQIYYVYLSIPRTVTIDRVALSVSTAVASTQISVGIYSSSNGYDPDTLLLDTGVYDTTATGIKENIVSLTLNAGLYVVAVATSGAPTILGSSTASPLASSFYGQTAPGSTFQHGWRVPFTYGTLPTTATNSSQTYTNSFPLIFLRAA